MSKLHLGLADYPSIDSKERLLHDGEQLLHHPRRQTKGEDDGGVLFCSQEGNHEESRAADLAQLFWNGVLSKRNRKCPVTSLL